MRRSRIRAGSRGATGQLAAAGAFLAGYHDAVAGTDLAGGSEVVCHGDFGAVEPDLDRRRAPFVIDFDNAHPGPRLEDVGYALWKFEIEASPDAFLRGYGLPLNARDAVDYAKQRERERFTQNDWPITFRRVSAEPSPFSGVTLPFGRRARVAPARARPRRAMICSSSTSRRIRSGGRGRGEDLLLRLDAEVDAGGELPHEIGRVGVGNVDVALGGRRQLAEDLERPLDVVLVERLVVVDTSSTTPVWNERPRVSSRSRKRLPPSTTTFIRPSSSVSTTAATRARVPISCTAPSPVASTSPNSPSVSRHSPISSR